jgi:hypothetical protein
MYNVQDEEAVQPRADPLLITTLTAALVAL